MSANEQLGRTFAADGVTPQLQGTVYDAFCATAAAYPVTAFIDVPSLAAEIYGIEPGVTTYRQALALINGLRDQYQQAGYGHGHRAALLLENRPAFFWHWLALNGLGVSVVPLNADFQVAELRYLLDNSRACVAVSIASHHERIAQAAKAENLTVQIFAPGEAVPAAPTKPSREGAPGLLSECGLLYTSGTTGQPKGCILPNEYYLFAGVWYRDLGGAITLSSGERLLSPLPLVHMNAMANSSMVMLLTGGTVILIDRFHPDSWWQTVRDSRASIIHYLGVMPAMLLGAPASEADRQHHVRFGFGAGVDRRHHAVFEDRFGFPLVEGWAMTETGAGGCIMASEEPRKVGTNSFGRPPKGVAWRIVDDHGQDLPADEPGELLVRWSGADPQFGFFKGYLKKPEATAQAWEGGWFHTGDIVRCDADGDMHFVDRKKNVIRRSGENISAVEVEGVLMQHTAVVGVGVAPVPDEVRGDEVMACVIVDPEYVADGNLVDESLARGISEHCLENLAYFKAPGYIAFVDKLPLTATQKVQRAGLRDTALDCLNASHARCFDLRDMKKRQSQ